MKRRLLGLTLGMAAGIAVLLGVEPASVERGPGSQETVSLTLVTTAASARPARRAVRRTARRTTRRVSRRHNYYYGLPTGCAWRAPYHYCGGVYYQEQVVDGQTVYIIVTP